MIFSASSIGSRSEDKPEELKIEEIKSRKPPNGKKMTNAQKIIEWCDNQESGKVFKINELLHDTGLNRDIFKNIKKDNKTIKNLFNDMKTDKRGYYQIK